jgi:threonine/homoserine/homoserine lactone efflux protein
MDWSLFPRGIVIGLSVAAPIGPMAVLCIRRTLAQGRLSGIVSGLGVATADACYGAIAAFGITSVAALLVDQTTSIRLVGGLFLLYLGLKTLTSPPAVAAPEPTDRRASRGAAAYASTLALTLTNPTTILSFAAIFAGFGVAAGGRGSASAAALVAGVFAGSALWWLLLAGGTGLLRGWLTPARLRWVNRLSGTTIAAFGVLALIGSLR